MIDGGYILTEIWRARPAWLELPDEQRIAFFDNQVGPLLISMFEQGAEIVTVAINDNAGPEAMDYTYMAVWRMKDKAQAEHLENAARDVGFLEYFEQVNFGGAPMDPESFNGAMLRQR